MIDVATVALLEPGYGDLGAAGILLLKSIQAAARGGRIDRDDINAGCGYDDCA